MTPYEAEMIGRLHTENEDGLARFETLVLAQQPATVPWKSVTDYSFEARKEIEGKHPELIWHHLIWCDDADVLDYGCGSNATLVRLLEEYRDNHQRHSQVRIRGYDPASNPATEQSVKPPIKPIWDLVICREVLEHCTIRQIRQVVAELCDFSAHLVYVTTRFHLAPQHLLDVMTSDALDPTHISMLNQTLLRVLFVLEGFKRRADLEARMDWKNLGRVLVYERAT